jgi:hypothetical protein
MTVGTTTNLSESENQIILDALIDLGVYGAEDSIQANDQSKCSRVLKRMIKTWESSGAHIWTDEVARVWLQYDQRTYSLGNDSSVDDHWAVDYVETDLTDDLADNATAVTVTSTTGMTVGDNIGIVMDTNGIHWTTIATIPTSTTLTLTAGVTETCTSDALVYTYTSRPHKPLRVYDINRVSDIRTNLTESPMMGISLGEYHAVQTKLSNGTPVQWNYKSEITSGVLSVWKVPTDMSDRLSIHYQRPLFNFDSGTDTADVPAQWYEAVVAGLAYRLANAYGLSAKVPMLKAIADETFELANTYDREVVSTYFKPSRERS